MPHITSSDLMVQDQEGNTALHEAAFCGQVNAACILVEAGAPIKVKNHLGLTPLEYAKGSPHFTGDVVAYLAGAELALKERAALEMVISDSLAIKSGSSLSASQAQRARRRNSRL